MLTLGLNRLGSLVLFAIAAVGPAGAGQQKWAANYLNWSFEGDSSAVINIDQEFWIAQSAPDSFWVFDWTFEDSADGGYVGLQQQGLETRARFSIWNATEARGAACETFGGEGVGYTCTLPTALEPGKRYRLRLWRLDADADAQWWGAWLIEQDASGKLVERQIGEIKAPAGSQSIAPDSISNFMEFFGEAVTACRDIPLAVVGFAPPALNADGQGAYGRYGSFAGSSAPDGNGCKIGDEDNGALVTVVPRDFTPGAGALGFMGATRDAHDTDPAAYPIPPALPPS